MSRHVLSYCAQEVKTGDPDRFLSALFVPMPQREALFAAYALNVELARVPGMVSEEMLGHIRYAWWQEGVEALYNDQPVREHPVLQALKACVDVDCMPQVGLQPVVDAYRNQYPEAPPEMDRLMEMLSLLVIRAAYPKAERGWRRANRCIVNHRYRYEDKKRGWLHFKLLLLGLMP